MLRGLNLPINAKLPDFMPLKNKTALEALPLYGTTIARVLFSWEAFEPERGQYSMDYLDYYLGLVEVRLLHILYSGPSTACRHTGIRIRDCTSGRSTRYQAD